jgi:hypothetical protein
MCVGSGRPSTPRFSAPRHFAGIVAADSALCRAVHLHQHGIVNVGPEGLLDSVQIGLVAVTGKLDAAGEAKRQIADEVVCCGRGAASRDSQPHADEAMGDCNDDSSHAFRW